MRHPYGCRGLLLLGGLWAACALTGDGSCSADPEGRVPKVSDAVRWWSEALAGRSTRFECEQQADRLLLALKSGCLPMHEPALWEAAVGLTYQILHDGQRTLRVLELQISTMDSNSADSEQVALLRDRVDTLREYEFQLAAIDSQAAAAPDRLDGCGILSSQPSTSRRASSGVTDGGWLLTTRRARAQWGGEGRCTIREISDAEWLDATPACRKRLVQFPFVVRGGGDALLGRSQFQRDAMLATVGQSHAAVGHPNYSAPVQTPFDTYLESMRQEEAADSVDEGRSYVFETQLLERHHGTLLRGLRLPHQLVGLINVQAPILANLAMGPAGSGVYFHRHDAAVSVLSFGEKRWFFHPDLPGSPAMREDHVRRSEGFLMPGASSSGVLANQSLQKLDELGVASCVQRPGDLIYSPHMWYHATTSLSETISVALRESAFGPMVTDSVGRSRYLPLSAATRRWATLTDGLEGKGYVPLTHEETGQPRPVSAGRLSFDWGRGWLSSDVETARGEEDLLSGHGDFMVMAASPNEEALRQIELREQMERRIPSREELLERLANSKNKRRGVAGSRGEL